MDATEVIEEMVISNPNGIHVRPAAKLVQTLQQYDSEVTIKINQSQVNAKSIMSVLTLAAAQGSRLVVTCRGPEAERAMEAVRELIEGGFDDGEEVQEGSPEEA